uniref:Uncharacterized protein n=1 Tax=Chromera velia CCMP2878 TaxID=1169474 RepID=A0A0G4HIJ9_9ALVE|eukprot:Cvel_27875.t1-p1 / transcript=Cvel_27875.t1 / gene=Cvel_27875 / organism=Chromera_velia_CCMP2878 / gene_product=hypothetical protein / transcript_product=hypothetical protein / location=Cvel_scaffold3549:13546-14057(+) / protein_length=79 / sequence_SO=supercontig / SO=protein_coding / is_pseudo=false
MSRCAKSTSIKDKLRSNDPLCELVYRGYLHGMRALETGLPITAELCPTDCCGTAFERRIRTLENFEYDPMELERNGMTP